VTSLGGSPTGSHGSKEHSPKGANASDWGDWRKYSDERGIISLQCRPNWAHAFSGAVNCRVCILRVHHGKLVENQWKIGQKNTKIEFCYFSFQSIHPN
jgi:hypothetical protein